MWHASACAFAAPAHRIQRESRRLAVLALAGVGDAKLGEWEEAGIKNGVWHVKRRLTDAEREEFGVPDPIDIRGTDEERARIERCLLEIGSRLTSTKRTRRSTNS